MAAQIHVCESETFMGVGIIAGGRLYSLHHILYMKAYI